MRGLVIWIECLCLYYMNGTIKISFAKYPIKGLQTVLESLIKWLGENKYLLVKTC